MSVLDLETLIEQSDGYIELDPTDTFFLDNPINVQERDLTIRGNGAVVQWRSRQRKKSAPFFALRHASGLIEGLVLVGQKDPEQGYVAAREGQHGFSLNACSDLTLRDCIVSHVPGDFIYARAITTGTESKGTLAHEPCRRILVDRFTGIDAGRHRIAAVGVGFAQVPAAGPNEPGLVVTASCFFRGWRRSDLDRERMSGYKTPLGAVRDESTSIKRAA